MDRNEAQKLKDAEEGVGQWSESHVLRETEGEEEDDEDEVGRDEEVGGEVSEDAALLHAKAV